MKKLLTSILLAGSLALTGCGSDNNDFVSGGGVINPVPVVQGYFVNSATGSDVTGAFATGSRFATIQAALLAAPAGSDIIVEPGNYAGAVSLENGDRLLGSESTLLMGTATTRPILTGAIDLADGNTVDFVRLQNIAGDAINGNGQNGGTVTNCEIATTTGAQASGVEMDGAQGLWTVSNNVITGTGGNSIFVRVTGNSILRIVADSNNISGSALGAIAMGSLNDSQVRASIVGNIFTGNNTTNIGDAFEVECQGDSTFCLNLEDNTNTGGAFSLFDSPAGASALSVEERDLLTAPQNPGPGAGNTGTVNLNTGIGGDLPIDLGNGLCVI